jgi:hypothetical protein
VIGRIGAIDRRQAGRLPQRVLHSRIRLEDQRNLEQAPDHRDEHRHRDREFDHRGAALVSAQRWFPTDHCVLTNA